MPSTFKPMQASAAGAFRPAHDRPSQAAIALVSVGFAVDDGSESLLFAELHSEAGQVSFVSLPTLLDRAENVAGIDRLVVEVESGKVRLVGNDRQAWNGFMGSWQ